MSHVTHENQQSHTCEQKGNGVWEADAAEKHTATRCNTLQHAATHCNTLQHTATHCNTLQHTGKKKRRLNAASKCCCSTPQHALQHTRRKVIFKDAASAHVGEKGKRKKEKEKRKKLPAPGLSVRDPVIHL